jgi:hypothetical protein
VYSRAARRHTHRRVECGECGSVPEQALILPSGADQLHAQRQPRPAAPAWETSTTYKTRWPLASGRSGGLSQHQIVLQAARASASLGQPAVLGRAGRSSLPGLHIYTCTYILHMQMHICISMPMHMPMHTYADAYAYIHTVRLLPTGTVMLGSPATMATCGQKWWAP